MEFVKVFDSQQEVCNALARQICHCAEKAIDQRGVFNFVLSGGNSPRLLYKTLVSEAFRNKIDWQKTYFFFGDERYVPANDNARNSLMAQETLFDPLSINDNNIFKVDTSKSPANAASAYFETIKGHFKNELVVFDFILLGLGDNSHTASLFPHTDVLKTTESNVQSVYVAELNANRITMTAPLINQARAIAFLVFGKDKSKAVYQILNGNDGSISDHPARLISKDPKQVTWYLDKEAASEL